MNLFSPNRKQPVQAEPGRQVVSFFTAGTAYGLDIEAVRELIAFQGFEPLPESPAWSPGTFDLRGKIIPAVDLRLRLGLEPAVYDNYTVIVVVNSAKGLFGLVVDRVSDVLELPRSSFQPPPGGALGGPRGHISAAVRHEDGLIYILDPDRLAGDGFDPDH